MTNRNSLHKTAHLTYYVADEKLRGYIGKHFFNDRVFSGGGRGHKEVNKKTARSYRHFETGLLKSRLATTGEKKDSHGKYLQRGGTIPPGDYVCQYTKDHHTFHECIWLAQEKNALYIKTPFSAQLIHHGRTKNDFFIHGAGPKGSDGCLVFPFVHDERRKKLNQAIHEFPGTVILTVVNNSYELPAALNYGMNFRPS